MSRKLVLLSWRAAPVAGLVSAWLFSNIPFPSVFQWLLNEEEILPSYDEGLISHAWLLGPLFFAINLLAWLPLMTAVVYLFEKKPILERLLGVALMLAGVLTAIATCRIVPMVIGHCLYEGKSAWDDFFLFFLFIPRLAASLIAIIGPYRILSKPRSQRYRTSQLEEI